jgi:hypothetical protein
LSAASSVPTARVSLYGLECHITGKLTLTLQKGIVGWVSRPVRSSAKPYMIRFSWNSRNVRSTKSSKRTMIHDRRRVGRPILRTSLCNFKVNKACDGRPPGIQIGKRMVSSGGQSSCLDLRGHRSTGQRELCILKSPDAATSAAGVPVISCTFGTTAPSS